MLAALVIEIAFPALRERVRVDHFPNSYPYMEVDYRKWQRHEKKRFLYLRNWLLASFELSALSGLPPI